MITRQALCVFILLAGAFTACDAAHSSGELKAKAPAPAKVEQYTNEGNLATLTLTPEAEKRLGIVTASIERKSVKRRRTYGGDVIVPPGHSVSIIAPLAGTLLNPGADGVEPPSAGALVKKGQALYSFLPLLSPERSVLTPAERVRLAEARSSLASSRIEAQGQVEAARVKIEAAQVALKRAEQLRRDEVGSDRAVDEAKAQLSLAQKELEAARAREAQVAKTVLDAESGTLETQTIRAPQDGLVSNVHVAAGQVVTAGTPLLEIMNQDALWIRVPVYVGEVASIDRDAYAAVGGLTDAASTDSASVRPVAAPPSANPDAATVDLFYEINQPKGFEPGRRVAVTLDLRDSQESLVAPWSAVLHDIHGGTWVYEKTKDQTYSRRRVQVHHVDGGVAVLAAAPQPGTLIVTDGAAELFGTEFGNK